MRPRIYFPAVLLLVVASLVTVGCGEKLDPTDPEGAYNLYIKSLWAGDAEAVWERLAPTTKEYFQNEYETLVEMDETIRRYLPPTDHRIAREQAGSILTDDVDSGKGLFLKLFEPSSLQLTEGHKVGASVEEIKINEDETAAELKTLGGDTYLLSRGENEEWFVMLTHSSSSASSKVEERMKWLESNQSALKQTVEDLIAEEREEREEVIGELMKLEKDGRQQQQEEHSGDNGD